MLDLLVLFAPNIPTHRRTHTHRHTQMHAHKYLTVASRIHTSILFLLHMIGVVLYAPNQAHFVKVCIPRVSWFCMKHGIHIINADTCFISNILWIIVVVVVVVLNNLFTVKFYGNLIYNRNYLRATAAGCVGRLQHLPTTIRKTNDKRLTKQYYFIIILWSY